MSARVLIAAVLGLSTASCLTQRGYKCTATADCDLGGGGICEANGYCSYEDMGCDSGQRYESNAEGVGGQCVPVEMGSTGPSTGTDGGSESDGDGTTTDAPTTGGSCEPACEAFCAEVLEVCPGSEYINEAICLAHCEQWPLGGTSDLTGDSLYCRLNNLPASAPDSGGGPDGGGGCAAASPNGGETCHDPLAPSCSEYCAAYQSLCGTGEGDDLCTIQCGDWYPGHRGDENGASIACRITALDRVAEGDAVSCNAAGPSGGGECVLPDC